MKLTDEPFDDDTIGIEGESSGGQPTGRHAPLPYYSVGHGHKPSLPRGSETFQQVLHEIEKEREGDEPDGADTLGQLKPVGGGKAKDSNSGDGHRLAKGSMWKVASMKLFKRTKSQRELLRRQ